MSFSLLSSPFSFVEAGSTIPLAQDAPSTMPFATIEYGKFLENVKAIEQFWGADGQHNDGLWTTSSWSEHLLTFIDQEVWDCQTRGVQEKALNIFALHPKPDIYDITFPSVERFRMIGVQIRNQAYYYRNSWVRRQTTWEFERLTAMLTHKLVTNRPPNLEMIQQTALHKLRFDRRFSSVADALLYQGWVADITSVAGIMSRSNRAKEQIIGAIGACSKIAKMTNPKEAGEEIPAKVLIAAYLPNSNQFGTLCQRSLEDIRLKMVDALPSHPTHSSFDPFSPLSRNESAVMIEAIAELYDKADRDEVRRKLTLLVASASSEGKVDDRVIAYLRELRSKTTIHQLPYLVSLPETINALRSSS